MTAYPSGYRNVLLLDFGGELAAQVGQQLRDWGYTVLIPHSETEAWEALARYGERIAWVMVHASQVGLAARLTMLHPELQVFVFSAGSPHEYEFSEMTGSKRGWLSSLRTFP